MSIGPADAELFVSELRDAFREQESGAWSGGAMVTDVLLIAIADDDFSVEVIFHARPAGPLHSDVVERTLAYLNACGAASPSELAAFWVQELDEQLLAVD